MNALKCRTLGDMRENPEKARAIETQGWLCTLLEALTGAIRMLLLPDAVTARLDLISILAFSLAFHAITLVNERSSKKTPQKVLTSVTR